MKSRNILNALILVVLLVGTLSLPALSAPAITSPVEAGDKIESLVLEELQANGQTDYFVWMVEKADLSPAYQLPTKLEKGQFVFETLRATADRTQADLRRFLDGQGANYRAFYVANKILVRGGSQELLVQIASRQDVAQITANHELQLEDPFINPRPPGHVATIEPNITFINADDAWALGITGDGTVMAGNDTGLDWDHPAIINKYRGWNGVTADHNYNWWDATGTYPTVPGDGHGHGTHTTGTMVGDDGGSNQIGVAPGAQTVHCKNMTDGGSGSDATFTECFEWDLAPWDLNGNNPTPALAPDAINNSWGYWGGNSPQFKDEIQALHAAGVLVEVSAGNEGSGCSTLRSPGDYWEVLTTGSVNHAAPYPGTMTGFSSRGPSDIDGNYFPDITAPGENIRSSVPGGGYQGGWSGTSMSGPHATALVGLIWQACPALAGQVYPTMDMIIETATPVTSYVGSCGGNYTTGPNNDWGYGTIDAYAAVQAAIAFCGAEFGTLEGHVYDVNGNPVEGASVTAQITGEGIGLEAITDPNGFYTMQLMVGTYTVTASKSGYYPEQVTGVEILQDQTTVQDFYLEIVPPPTVLWFDDFEGGTGNWTFSGLWHVELESDTCGSQVDPFPSSVTDMYYGLAGTCTYNNGNTNSGSLTMAVDVSIPADAAQPELWFGSFEETECGGDCSWDDRSVEASTNGGGTWTALGEAGQEGAWYQKTFDLSAYIGQSVRFRFTFDTVDSVGNDYFGWMVDDVTIVASLPGAENTLHVDQIKMQKRVLGGGRYVVYATLRILDQDGAPLAGALVDGEWTLPGGGTDPQQATTNLKGLARYRVKSLVAGTFTFCVTDVTKDGYVYDPDQNGETCDSITVP